MKRPLIAFIAVLAFAATTSAGAADDDAEKKEVRDCVARLASADADVRAAAAARILELGWVRVAQVARDGASLDADAWKALADASAASDRRFVLAASFVNIANTAPEAHRARLMAAAKRLEPEKVKDRTPEEIAALVHEYAVERAGDRCTSGYELEIALCGHAAAAPVLDLLEKRDAHVAAYALPWIAEKEDVPRIRGLLLAGRTRVARALGSLSGRGVPEAADALLDAVAAGRFDDDVAVALESAPDKPRAAKAVIAWAAATEETTTDQRQSAALLFQRFGAREAVPTLAAWLAKGETSGDFARIGEALFRLGDVRGFDTLVRIVGEPEAGRRPCMGNTRPDRPGGPWLCEDGFGTFWRWDAAREIAAIAGPEVLAVPSDDTWWREWRAAQAAKRPLPDEKEFLAKAGAAFRAWFDASKQKLDFDDATRRWSVAK